MDRQQAAQKVIDAKIAKNLTWLDIASVTENAETWVTTALLGQATMTLEQAQKVGALLDLDKEVIEALTHIPQRGSAVQMPPTDPLLYRFYEALMVYGPTIKELIQEKFGEGIMSAIDFELDLQRIEDPKGDRVFITLNGKFLPYRKW
ncbi:cyanase [Paenibacillus polysaccharolyticus]|uniref:cyanase n=1 Tax=Paenibacillus polysaccharolyticus TaxID=582692 RepID=UPI00209CD754|nr:cyanase [Paenibacillus polysaccharolyticus]MCP1136197.1 cyanase [Paenibacillus polysaccharolyticus]